MNREERARAFVDKITQLPEKEQILVAGIVEGLGMRLSAPVPTPTVTQPAPKQPADTRTA